MLDCMYLSRQSGPPPWQRQISSPPNNRKAPPMPSAKLGSPRRSMRPATLTDMAPDYVALGETRTYSFDAITREADVARRSEEHTSELQSLMRTSYAVFCLKKKKEQD